MIEHVCRTIKKTLDDYHRSKPECPECPHRNDNHHMNCIECCPAERNAKSAEGETR